MTGIAGKQGELEAGDHGYAPKRGRPSRAQVEALEKAILSVGRSMFLENGYASTAMESVAASAGVSKGTLYSRYPTKADLFKAIVAERLSEWAINEELPQDVEKIGIAEYLVQFGTVFLKGLDKPEVQAFDRLITTEAGRFLELANEFHQQGYVTTVDSLAEQIERAGRLSGWPVSDAFSVARHFIGALLGLHRSTMSAGSDKPYQIADVVRLVALFMGGRSAW